MTRRTTGWLGLGVVAASTALITGVVLVSTGDDPTQRVSTGPPIRIGAEPAAGPAIEQAEAEQVVRTVLDRAADPSIAAAAIDADDAAELLVHIRRAAATAGVVSTEIISVGIEVAAGDRASVDATISTSGNPTGSSGVNLRHLTLVREDGTWRMTREAACGIASGGGMLATPPGCASPMVVHRVGSIADPLEVMGELPGAEIRATWDRLDATAYGSELVAGPAGMVAVEYPGTEVGGGGPQGPVELVRLDPDTGRETGRLRPGGDDAQVVVGTEAIWVLANAPIEPDGTGGWGRFLLTRVDADTFRPTGQMVVDGEHGALLGVSGDTAWVHHDGGLQRIEGPDPHVTGTVAGVAGPIGDEELVAATSHAVVVRRPTGGPALFVDTSTLERRDVAVPDGHVIASGDRLWITGSSVRRLDADGVAQGSPVEVPDGGEVLPDGRGGVWLTGEVLAGWSGRTWDGGSLQVVAVRRPVAIHLDAEGSVDTTLVAAGTGAGGQQARFTAAGPRAVLWASGTVSLLDETP